MADIKISNLEETNNLNGFYVPGVAEDGSGNLVSKKFLMDNFQDNINKAVNSIQSGINPFNTTVNYYTGEYVTYGTGVYRFIVDHPAGVWVSGEVEEVSIYGELASLLSTDSETVHINISSSDSQLINLNNIVVTITINNTVCITKYSDSNGNCSFNIPIGQPYTIHLDDQLGYQSIGDSTYTAELNNRYINIVYQKDTDLDTTCTVNIKFNLINGGNISDFEGLNVYLLKNNNENIYTSTISNGISTFQDITKGVSYTTIIPQQITYYKNITNNIKFISDNITLNFDYDYDGIRWQSGLFLLYLDNNNNYREVDLDTLYTDPSDTTTWRGEELGINETNALAIHVCPKFLYEIGCDYFVKIQDLAKTRSTSDPSYNLKFYYKSGASTAPSGLLNFIPNDSANSSNGGFYYEDEFLDGEYYSYLMMYFCLNDGYSCPILDYIQNETFTYKNNNLIGFFGTAQQMYQIFLDPNKEKIKNVLLSLSYTPTFSKNVKYNIFKVSGGYGYFINGETGATSLVNINSIQAYALPLFTTKSIKYDN